MSGTQQPVLFVADDDPDALARTEAELRRRYGRDYRIASEGSTEAAAADLERMRDQGDRVTLVLADVWMAEKPGSELLDRVRSLHPQAKRALLIDWGAWGDRPTAEAILHAMATGRADYYVLKPTRAGEEQFHRAITEFLHEWSREHSESSFELAVVAEPAVAARPRDPRPAPTQRGSAWVHLSWNGVWSEAARGRDRGHAGEAPVVRMRDGTVLVDPSNEEIVEAFGVDTEPVDDPNFDLVIIGAGPAGLSAAVYASSEGLRTLVLERETIGGQAGSSSLIRNYLGFARGITGAELAQRAYQQAWVFGVQFALSREVVSLGLEREPYGVGCDGGYIASGRAVLLATA